MGLMDKWFFGSIFAYLVALVGNSFYSWFPMDWLPLMLVGWLSLLLIVRPILAIWRNIKR